MGEDDETEYTETVRPGQLLARDPVSCDNADCSGLFLWLLSREAAERSGIFAVGRGSDGALSRCGTGGFHAAGVAGDEAVLIDAGNRDDAELHTLGYLDEPGDRRSGICESLRIRTRITWDRGVTMRAAI